MAPKKGWRSVRKKPSGKYEARWTDESGRERAQSFWTKAQAQKFADDTATAVGNAEVGIAALDKPVSAALADFLERRLDPKTTALNARRMGEFLAAMPEVRMTGQITDKVINKFDALLESTGHNPGGRQHVLKIVRAFCNYCRKKKWLIENPFEGFKMPTSEFEGRALSEDEFERMCTIGWTGSNQHGGTHWAGTNQRPDADRWLRRAFIFGRGTMLRVSQVWKLTPADFRAPDQLWVEGIKGQEGVWITLHPDALAVLQEVMALPGRAVDARFFGYWASVGSMQTAVYNKARRVGLPGVRFHDVCKVTRITELASHFNLAELEQLSNTTKRTLVAHYIKADRQKTFARYQRFASARHQPATSPEKGPNTGNTGHLAPQDATASTDQNGSNSLPIPNL